jgi:hypothetical protein
MIANISTGIMHNAVLPRDFRMFVDSYKTLDVIGADNKCITASSCQSNNFCIHTQDGPWAKMDRQTEHSACTELCADNITMAAAVVVNGNMPKPYPKESLLSIMAAVIHKNATARNVVKSSASYPLRLMHANALLRVSKYSESQSTLVGRCTKQIIHNMCQDAGGVCHVAGLVTVTVSEEMTTGTSKPAHISRPTFQHHG